MITSSIDLITIGLARLVSEDVKAIPCHALRMLAMHQVDIILPRVLGLLDLPNFEIARRSEVHTSELQSLMSISSAVFCLKKQLRCIQTVPCELHSDVLATTQ